MELGIKVFISAWQGSSVLLDSKYSAEIVKTSKPKEAIAKGLAQLSAHFDVPERFQKHVNALMDATLKQNPAVRDVEGLDHSRHVTLANLTQSMHGAVSVSRGSVAVVHKGHVLDLALPGSIATLRTDDDVCVALSAAVLAPRHFRSFLVHQGELHAINKLKTTSALGKKSHWAHTGPANAMRKIHSASVSNIHSHKRLWVGVQKDTIATVLFSSIGTDSHLLSVFT